MAGSLRGQEAPPFAGQLPVLEAPSAFMIEARSGTVLFSKNPDLSLAPASLTKLITSYLIFKEIQKGFISLHDRVPVLPLAARRPLGSSLMGLKEGDTVSVRDLLEGTLIASGNDAAYTLALYVGKSPQRFVDMMNREVSLAGYRHLSFVDPDGYSEDNRITAREIVFFARDYIRDFPEALHDFFSKRFLIYPKEPLPKGRKSIRKHNTNRLLGKYPGVDGMKTGYINESGFNFLVTARQNNMRLIAVVLGIRAENYQTGLRKRAAEGRLLLDYGFSRFEVLEPREKPLAPLRVWNGKKDRVRVLAPRNIRFVIPRKDRDQFYSEITLPKELDAPVKKGEKLGEIRYFTGEKLLNSSPLLAAENIEKGNLFKVIHDFFKRKIKKKP